MMHRITMDIRTQVSLNKLTGFLIKQEILCTGIIFFTYDKGKEPGDKWMPEQSVLLDAKCKRKIKDILLSLTDLLEQEELITPNEKLKMQKYIIEEDNL